ncbi:DMT family transporter [Priestia megaterium]|uniref:DMT family transporter n=1 Tax=Priestia megaterium TaxID=1404 RepID=UPI0022205D9C|nr:DMT family transporter [Priestia megaterium]UYV51828.1 DMT family transporter [Priestia megaterium]
MKAGPMVKMMVSMSIFGSIGFFSTQTGLPSFDLVFVRCICATLFLGMCWFVTGEYKREKWNAKEIKQILLCGIFLVFNWVFLFKAFEMMSVTVAISIYHLAPVLVLLLGSFIFKEKLTVLGVMSIFICFVGTLLVIGVKELTIDGFMSSGILWALLAALFYACTTLLGKGIIHTSAYAVTFLQTFLGIFLLLPFVHFSDFYFLTTANWTAILVTGFVHTGLVYYLFFDSLRYLKTQVISVLVFLDPAVAILLDTAFTGFRPTLFQLAGIVLIFLGMLFTLKPKPSSKKNISNSKIKKIT